MVKAKMSFTVRVDAHRLAGRRARGRAAVGLLQVIHVQMAVAAGPYEIARS